MTDDIWNARRKKLEGEIIAAVFDLFKHTGSDALCLDLDPPHGKLLLLAGPTNRIQASIGSPIRQVLRNLAREVCANMGMTGNPIFHAIGPSNYRALEKAVEEAAAVLAADGSKP